MSFSPNGTVLFEENNIRYQMYSDEFYESTLECIIESRINGSIYSDFSVDVESIKKDTKDYLNNAVFIIIAIDISKEVPIVVGSVLGEDLAAFTNGYNISSTSNKQLNTLKQVVRRGIQPFIDMQYKQGDVLLGSGYGVLKEYQKLNIGQNLGMLFIGACLGSSYKMFLCLFYNQKVKNVPLNGGAQLFNELKAEDCTDIDKNLASYMKNGISIIIFVDTRKDVKNLSLPQNNFIRPSL